MAAAATSLAVVALLAAMMMLGAEAVWLDLPPTGTKCVSEEIQPNVVVVADYAIIFESQSTSHPTVAVKPEKGSGVSLNLDWKIGIAAKDWDSVAKKEKIEGVELELRKLEVAVESIHHNLLYLKAREAEMREVSEKTNSRVAWFSILSLGVCVVVSVLQLWHLQGFFHKKKLI